MTVAAKRDLLPPLAFGERHASITNSAVIAAEMTARSIPCLQAFEPAGRDMDFCIKFASVGINGLTLVANSAAPLKTEIGASDAIYLNLCLYGRAYSEDAHGRHEMVANRTAALFAECGRRFAVAEKRSLLIAQLDKNRLIGAARAMLGDDSSQDASLELERTRSLALQYGPVNFTTLFRQIGLHIDALYNNHTALQKLGVDDMFYRHAVFLLRPDVLIGDAGDEKMIRQGSQGPVDAVCDAARSQRRRPLTLTEMERISGLSRRSLQYAFRKRFGCSPMQWQQQERLHLAREKLLRGEERINITDLAYELGFSTPSSFAAFYGRLFGETPTATMAQSFGASLDDPQVEMKRGPAKRGDR